MIDADDLVFGDGKPLVPLAIPFVGLEDASLVSLSIMVSGQTLIGKSGDRGCLANDFRLPVFD